MTGAPGTGLACRAVRVAEMQHGDGDARIDLLSGVRERSTGDRATVTSDARSVDVRGAVGGHGLGSGSGRSDISIALLHHAPKLVLRTAERVLQLDYSLLQSHHSRVLLRTW